MFKERTRSTKVISGVTIFNVIICFSALFVFVLSISTPAVAQDKIKLKVIGQPVASGLIQKNKEQPFFESLAQKSGLPLEIEYKPIDTTGIKDTEQLRVMELRAVLISCPCACHRYHVMSRPHSQWIWSVRVPIM